MIFKKGVQIEGVCLKYGEWPVLNDINLYLQGGKVTTLLGPNGCGKTTLLKIISGLINPTAGRVYVDGHEASMMGRSRLAGIMGYVHQGHRSSFPFTALEIVLTGRTPYISTLSVPGQEDIQTALRSLSLVGVEKLAKRPYTQISGGERQLVMIARAMAQEPSILLLDEPTSYLDFKNQILTLKLVREIALSREVTVIMTLHDPNHALMFSDQVVLMQKLGETDGHTTNSSLPGNIIASGKPFDVLSPRNIKEAYGMDVEILEHNNRKLLLPI